MICWVSCLNPTYQAMLWKGENLMEKKGIKPESAMSFNGRDIRSQDGLICLTDLWKAAGSESNRDPRQWKRKMGQQFIESVAEKLNVPISHIYKTTRGKNGGTYAHWQIALAYAKYLSHELPLADRFGLCQISFP